MAPCILESKHRSQQPECVRRLCGLPAPSAVSTSQTCREPGFLVLAPTSTPWASQPSANVCGPCRHHPGWLASKYYGQPWPAAAHWPTDIPVGQPRALRQPRACPHSGSSARARPGAVQGLCRYVCADLHTLHCSHPSGWGEPEIITQLVVSSSPSNTPTHHTLLQVNLRAGILLKLPGTCRHGVRTVFLLRCPALAALQNGIREQIISWSGSAQHSCCTPTVIHTKIGHSPRALNLLPNFTSSFNQQAQFPPLHKSGTAASFLRGEEGRKRCKNHVCADGESSYFFFFC